MPPAYAEPRPAVRHRRAPTAASTSATRPRRSGAGRIRAPPLIRICCPAPATSRGWTVPAGRGPRVTSGARRLRAGLTVRNYGMEGDLTRYDPHDRPLPSPWSCEPWKTDHRRCSTPTTPDADAASATPTSGASSGLSGFLPASGNGSGSSTASSGTASCRRCRCSPAGRPHGRVRPAPRRHEHAGTAAGRQRLCRRAGWSRRWPRARYAKDTLIFILEDDAQDGPDHVDAHRSTAYRRRALREARAVVSDYFTTVNMLRTIEDVLGIDHLEHVRCQRAADDGHIRPEAGGLEFHARRPQCLLAGTRLPLMARQRPARRRCVRRHDVAYWAARTQGMDFSSEDKVDPVGFNRIVWHGLMDTPYPTARSGLQFSWREPAPTRQP